MEGAQQRLKVRQKPLACPTTPLGRVLIDALENPAFADHTSESLFPLRRSATRGGDLHRRTKAELEDPLPPKRETLLKVELMPAQKRVYRAILDRAVEHIKNPRSSLRNVFMQLRKACDHSMLLEAGAAEEAAVEDALGR